MLTLSLLCLGVVLALMFLLWLVSLVVKDASIVDMFWGFGFVVVAWVGYVWGDGAPNRKMLVTALVTLWGLRLTFHLTRRNLGKGEDYRYKAMRAKHGSRFPLVSLGTVFGLQGVILWIVSLPVQAASSTSSSFFPLVGPTPPLPSPLTWIDGVGVLVWAVGLFFEAVGDMQLNRFKADPTNQGKVMDRGLWRYTRHPNYFGDFMVWWGIYLVALSAGAFWTAIGPALMSFFLMRVSGVPLLEQSLKKNRPGYAEYIARTSAFFPRPPRNL